MKYERFFKWLTLDMIVFFIANVLLIYFLRDKFVSLNSISYFELLVFGLAAFRAANIVSNEVVTKPLRAPFVEEVKKEGKVVEEPKRKGFQGAFGLLIYCPSCTGVWLSAALVYSYVFWPTPTFLIAFFLALSSIERIISAVIVRLKKDT